MTDRWDAFADLVDNDYDTEWQRKQSIETRSLALVTANIALLTVVTLVADRLDLLGELSHDSVRNLGIVSLLLYGLSTVIALFTAVPYGYDALAADDLLIVLDELGDEFDDGGRKLTDEDGRIELIEIRIEQIRTASDTNGKRAKGLVAGYLVAVAGAVCMAIAFGMAINLAPHP